MTDHPDDGDEGALTAKFLSRRVLDCEGTSVRRLLVAHDNSEFSLLVDPDAGAPLGLRTGDVYEFTNVVFCATATGTLEEECPDCGGQLRGGTTLDAWPELRTAADRLDLECGGVITMASSITEAPAPSGVDVRNWGTRSSSICRLLPQSVWPAGRQTRGGRTDDPVTEPGAGAITGGPLSHPGG